MKVYIQLALEKGLTYLIVNFIKVNIRNFKKETDINTTFSLCIVVRNYLPDEDKPT